MRLQTNCVLRIVCACVCLLLRQREEKLLRRRSTALPSRWHRRPIAERSHCRPAEPSLRFDRFDRYISIVKTFVFETPLWNGSFRRFSNQKTQNDHHRSINPVVISAGRCCYHGRGFLFFGEFFPCRKPLPKTFPCNIVSCERCVGTEERLSNRCASQSDQRTLLVFRLQYFLLYWFCQSLKSRKGFS